MEGGAGRERRATFTASVIYQVRHREKREIFVTGMRCAESLRTHMASVTRTEESPCPGAAASTVKFYRSKRSHKSILGPSRILIFEYRYKTTRGLIPSQ